MFETVREFEIQVAKFYGAPCAVATDCATHALELCLRATDFDNITVPVRTYVSVPMTLIKLTKQWSWRDQPWQDFYYLGNTNIIDAAVYWQENGYIAGTMMALSFQFKKHLSTTKGGMILLDDPKLAQLLRRMSYDGRDLSKPWAEQLIDTVGYHYYMTPETAQLGLARLAQAKLEPARRWDYTDYPYLPDFPVFGETPIDIGTQ